MRENHDWCGLVPGWGCYGLVVLLADFADGRCAGGRARETGAGCPFLKPASTWKII